MLVACTSFESAHALGLPFLVPVAWAFAWVALAAWCAAFAGLLRALGTGVTRLGSARPGA